MLRGTWMAIVGACCVVVFAEAGRRASAQIVESDPAAKRPTAVSYGPQTVARYKFGTKATARAGTVKNLRLMVAVPLECAEQDFELIEEDASPHVESVEFRESVEGVRQMLIYVPELAPRQEAYAYATFEVRTRTVLPPTETATLAAPKRPDRTLKRYLGPSPFIDVNDRKIRAAAKEALAELPMPAPGATGDWERVEALYDYALGHVKYKEGVDDKSSVQALADGEGDCQSIASLFVALCRTEKVPARLVWVDGHQYAEFYLADADGQGCWYPVESAGSRAFGEMPLARVILQKGDNFQIPERSGERLRYATNHAAALSAPGREPIVAFVCEMVE